MPASAGHEQSPSQSTPGRRRHLVWAVLLVAVAGIGGYLLGPYLSSKPSPASPERAQVVEGDGVRGPKSMVWIPAGEFLMGSDHQFARPNERPTHRVHVAGFWMDRTHVTNAQFAEFVQATGYLTTAERKPDWEAIRVQVPAGTPRPPD